MADYKWSDDTIFIPASSASGSDVVVGLQGGGNMKMSLDMLLTRKDATGTDAGGDITLRPGMGGDVSGNGGSVGIYAADSPGATGQGGSIFTQGGAAQGGDGGGFYFYGGQTQLGRGGQIDMEGGDSDNGRGGSVILKGGFGVNDFGGDVIIYAGGGTSAQGGALDFQSGSGDTGGGYIRLQSGNADAGNTPGGDISIQPGAGHGTGRQGLFILKNVPTADPGISGAVWRDASNFLKISP